MKAGFLGKLNTAPSRSQAFSTTYKIFTHRFFAEIRTMYITIWLLTLKFISLSSFTQADGRSNLCTPPKTVSLKVGQEGMIICICDDSTSLYWYFGNDTTAVSPFIYIDDSVKYGPGYLSGEYDINAQGSLVIKYVLPRHGGDYAVVIFEPGNPEPRRETFTVTVEGSEESDITKTSDCDQERKTADAEKVTTIATDEPGKESTSLYNENGEQFLDVADIKLLQAKIDKLQRIDQATLALLVIVLFGIGLVARRSYKAPLTKNSNCEEERVRCHQDMKRLLVSCPGSCPHGKSDESTDSS